MHSDYVLMKEMIPVVLQVLEGWPCISETLQWAPGCPVYLMGQYAALQVMHFEAMYSVGMFSSLKTCQLIMEKNACFNVFYLCIFMDFYYMAR